jgi:hypothetical protein
VPPADGLKSSPRQLIGLLRGEDALLEPHVRELDITGRPMKGWVLVRREGVEEDGQLADWIVRAARFVRALPAQGE